MAVRVYLQPVVRVLSQAWVDHWFGGRREAVHAAVSARRRENQDLQERFSAVFTKYDACSNCVEHCCHSNVNRFDFVDCFIYGRPFGEGLSVWHRPGHVGESVGDLIRQMRSSGDERAPCEVCPHFVTAKGCSLPIGERPSMCITGVCKKLLDSFSEEDAAEFVALLKKHARFRAECRRELVTALRRPASDGEEGPSPWTSLSTASRERNFEGEGRISADPAVDEVPQRSGDEPRG